MHLLILLQKRYEPAALFESALASLGATSETQLVHEEGVPSSLRGFDGLIVMGGPQSANDSWLPGISDQIALLKKAIEADFPVLGICLGAQLLAKAAGAEIILSPVPEHGWFEIKPTQDASADPLFRHLPASGQTIFQWHGESFTLPDGATLLASSSGVPHQAFRIGHRQYGLQFHPEVDEAIIREWIDLGDAERERLGYAGVSAIIKEINEHTPAAQSLCREIARAWLGLIRTETVRNPISSQITCS